MSAEEARCTGECPCRDCSRTRAAMLAAIGEIRQMLAAVEKVTRTTRTPT